MQKVELAFIREFPLVPLGFVPLGFGPQSNGIWPSIKVFGTQNLELQTLSVPTSKSATLISIGRTRSHISSMVLVPITF